MEKQLRFEHIEMFWGLALIGLFLLVFIIMRMWRARAIKRFASSEFAHQLAPRIATGKPYLKFILFSLGFAALIVALADPQMGSKQEEIKREGIDVMICLDVSNSMLAEDLTPNRLDRAKRGISQFLDDIGSDRLGIVAFAGQALVQVPITTDYPAIKMFLATVDNNSVPAQGTAIEAAIDLALESFDKESPTSKAIIVISDGESHDGDPIAAAARAADQDVVVHTIGIGSTSGTPIPLFRNGRQQGYRTDRSGSTVVTKLNEGMLQSIAAAGDGTYVHASNSSSGLSRLRGELNKLDKEEFGTMKFTDYESQYWWFAAIALVLIVLESIISNRSSTWFNELFHT